MRPANLYTAAIEIKFGIVYEVEVTKKAVAVVNTVARAQLKWTVLLKMSTFSVEVDTWRYSILNMLCVFHYTSLNGKQIYILNLREWEASKRMLHSAQCPKHMYSIYMNIHTIHSKNIFRSRLKIQSTTKYDFHFSLCAFFSVENRLFFYYYYY